MTKRNMARMREHAKIFKALAHPSRLCIIEALAAGKHCVRELTDLIGGDMSTVSRHLSVLRNAGVVGDEKLGLRVFYELRCKCILDFLECAESAAIERMKFAKSAYG